MPLVAAVIARTLLVRQPVAQSLSALDLRVAEFPGATDLDALVRGGEPSLVVMDADGMPQEWRRLVAELAARQRDAAFVVLATRFSFDDAHDAMTLKVSRVILKPFRPEEHAPRLLDVALRAQGLHAKRDAPRFPLPGNESAALKCERDGQEWDFDVANLALGGARLRLREDGRTGHLQPGAFLPLANLEWGEVRAELDVEVIWRTEFSAGVRFYRIYEGERTLARVLEDRRRQTLGIPGRKRKW